MQLGIQMEDQGMRAQQGIQNEDQRGMRAQQGMPMQPTVQPPVGQASTRF
jgi:hypothetical protein